MVKVCFVCLGNICRSPMAEFVMKNLNTSATIYVESRGTSDWEHGNPIHAGTQAILKKHDVIYNEQKGSQQITSADLAEFDIIIGMDEENIQNLQKLSKGHYDDKIFLFRDGGVPDPWYTGDFDTTYDLVKEGCEKWLTKL